MHPVMHPYQCWLDIDVKQFNCLRHSVYDLERMKPNLCCTQLHKKQQLIKTKFFEQSHWKHNRTISSAMKNPLRVLQWQTSTISGKLRCDDTTKQYVCLLSHNDTFRQLIVPQNWLIHCCPATFQRKQSNLLV